MTVDMTCMIGEYVYVEGTLSSTYMQSPYSMPLNTINIDNELAYNVLMTTLCFCSMLSAGRRVSGERCDILAS